MLVTIKVLISITGHVIIAGICNYLLPLLIPYFPFLPKAPQVVMVLYPAK